jgi:hypothetical protein
MTALKTMAAILAATEDTAWIFAVDGFEPMMESSVESRFAISNGFLGVRGARSTTRGERWVIPARTYVAGLFDSPGVKQTTQALVPTADWLGIRIVLPDGPLVRHPRDAPLHRMTLDMRRGALLSESHHLSTPDLGLCVRTLRLVSMSERAVGLQLIQLEVEHGEVDVTFEASAEGTGLGLATDRLDQALGLWHTRYSGKRLALATLSSLQIDGKIVQPVALGPLKWSWSWKTRPGQLANFERFVAIVRTDSLELDPGPSARDKLGLAQSAGWRRVVTAHEAAWTNRWLCSDVTIAGDVDAQHALRFAVYHLNGAANPADERVSIGARALTGDDYHGHVFWDTEIFLLPFYILTWPEAARTLLMYRFRTLGGARAKAAGMGWRGALYAWESAATGAEMSPEQVIGPDRMVVDVLCGRQEQHISADVAYAVWQYWQATGDDDFLLQAGAEILLETGRFWASRAGREADGHCHIRGVIGPDEYHERHRRQRLYKRHGALEHSPRVGYRRVVARALACALDGSRQPSRSGGYRTGAMAECCGNHEDRVRSQNRTVRAVQRLFRPGRHRPEELRRPVRAHGRGARARADAKLPGRETGRCRCAAGIAAGRIRGRFSSEEFRLLFVSLRPWKLVEPCHAWARCRPIRRYRNGIALLPPDGGH